jgi:two-component system, OmpR family, alkaline phosphatase synthesis response regulator PhoP
MPNILVVDDEPAILNVVTAYLKAEGYDVFIASDGPSALKAIKAYAPNLIILDIMLPGLDGLEVLARLRQESSVYVILLTAKTEEMDKVVGLSAGADDYVVKPFSPRELTARVKAALRRINAGEEVAIRSRVITFQNLVIDTGARTVIAYGLNIDLTAIEFDLLVCLVENRGRVMTRQQLLEKIWGYDYFGDTRVVDVHLGHLRHKIKSDVISTVRGVGYRFDGEVL